MATTSEKKDTTAGKEASTVDPKREEKDRAKAASTETTSGTAEGKTAANKRQEAADKEDAERTARRNKVLSSDSPTFTVVLRDDAESTVDSVSRLVALQGATVKNKSKGRITVELPPVPERAEVSEPTIAERNTGAARQRIIEHLMGDPLVEDVE